jgi:hypothetical protein
MNNNQKRGGYQRGSYNNSQSAKKFGSANATGTSAVKSDVVFEKLLGPTKSGKALASFVTGDEGLTIPPNTRVIIQELNEKQKAGLAKVAAERGWKSAPKTHKMIGFAIDVEA